jgi:tRNA A-37 threonylcarbamoyl transferase component Bud32
VIEESPMNADENRSDGRRSDQPENRPWSLLEPVVRRFEDALAAGERPAIEEFLTSHAGDRVPLLRELVHVDLEWRLKAGEAVRVEAYLERFPELTADSNGVLDLLTAECRHRFPELSPLSKRRLMERTAGVDLPATVARSEEQTPRPGSPDRGIDARPLRVEGPRYRDLRDHREGGLGEVHIAQDAELGREVALKRIRARYADDPEYRRRFIREAEVTGRLEHPGIVPIYGLTEDADGQPCYAMRFIEGESLEEALRGFHEADPADRDPSERRLAFRDLLSRFVTVCQTLAYAHSRGVLHRDLKPANIMLGKYGETLVVDWGLAKVQGRTAQEADSSNSTATGLPELNDATQEGAAVGTPAYMSPEQASGKREAIGPASDIYGLGATLYAVLTGQAPVSGSGMIDVLAKVRAGQVPAARTVKPELPKPLEAICRKALALRPEDRYASAADLAADLDRWLADEPVTAWPERWEARVWRWLRRHPKTVGGTAAFLLSLAVALAGLAAVIGDHNRELAGKNQELAAAYASEQEAKENEASERGKAVKAKDDAEHARDEAKQAQKQAETISDFLVKSFRKPDPYIESNQIKVEDLLAQAVRVLNDDRAIEPLTKAKLREALGMTYVGLVEGKNAIPLLQLSSATFALELGPSHSDTLASRNNLANAYIAAGRPQEGLQLHKQTLELREKQLGPDHPDTLFSRRELANAHRAAGRTREAIQLYQQTLVVQEKLLGPDHPNTLTSRAGLAAAYVVAGRTREAIQLYQQTLELQEKKLGPEHPDTLTSRNNLAAAYLDAGRTPEAIQLHQQTLELREKKLGPDHPDTLISRNNLATAYQDAGRTHEAIQLHQQTLELQEKKLGPDHPNTLASRHNLADAYANSGQRQEAIQLYQQTLELSEKKLGSDHPDTLISLNNLAVAYWSAQQLERSVTLFEEALRRRMRSKGENDPDTIGTAFNLGANYRDAGRLDAAVRLFDEWLARAAQVHPMDHPAFIAGRTMGAETYARAGRLNRAESLLREAANLVKGRARADSTAYTGQLAMLGLNLLLQKKWADAEAVLRDCLAIREKLAPDAWTTYNTQSMLGGSLVGQKKYAQAEPLLLKGYEGLKTKAKETPPNGSTRLTEAAERLVRLYEALGKPVEAARWKKELEKLRPPTAEPK